VPRRQRDARIAPRQKLRLWVANRPTMQWISLTPTLSSTGAWRRGRGFPAIFGEGSAALARIFRTPQRRVGARGLQSYAAPAGGRVPSRGTLMTIRPKCELSWLGMGIGVAVVPKMPEAVVKRKLIGNVALKSHRAVKGPANREEQLVKRAFSKLHLGIPFAAIRVDSWLVLALPGGAGWASFKGVCGSKGTGRSGLRGNYFRRSKRELR